ncbi:MAG: hypothetical protein R6X06_01775 [Gammaproteobacteria bacterium]
MDKYPRVISRSLGFSLATLCVLSACSWSVTSPGPLADDLQAALQTPVSVTTPEGLGANQAQLPLRVHYAIKHKPLRGQRLAVMLELYSPRDIAVSAYAVKLPETLQRVAPEGVVDLGRLQAGNTYHETIHLIPVSEGLHEIEIFVAVRLADGDTQIKQLRVPISVGPFTQ